MQIAVIDLGTNTCNLLVVEIHGTTFKIHHQSSQAVKLGDGAIHQDTISIEAIKRTIVALHKHQNEIKYFEIDEITVIGTSAIRSAKNQQEFLSIIKEKTGFEIMVISGGQEAELIYKGVLLAFENIKSNTLILDIGGGSNEFIFCSQNGIQWKESFHTGISRVIHSNKISDPLSFNEIAKLNLFFEKEHLPIIDKFSEFKAKTLIGCSGAFDTIADIIERIEPGEKSRIKQEISLKDFYMVYNKLVGKSKKEMLQIKGINPVRIDLIVPAIILIKQTIEKAGITSIYQTDYALREGILYEKLDP